MAARNSAGIDSIERVLMIEHVFDAPQPLVFKAWMEPQHLVHWYGPRGFAQPSCALDAQPGGAWRSCTLSRRP
jgi:uncharacterized protein YndB with AHSA1/START domain